MTRAIARRDCLVCRECRSCRDRPGFGPWCDSHGCAIGWDPARFGCGRFTTQEAARCTTTSPRNIFRR